MKFVKAHCSLLMAQSPKLNKMKKITITIIITLAFFMNLSAQNDGFFMYQYEQREDRNNDWAEILLLPNAHGLDYNYPPETPLGTGLLLLAGMGIGYGVLKRRE